jgi:hypothetical protein
LELDRVGKRYYSKRVLIIIVNFLKKFTNINANNMGFKAIITEQREEQEKIRFIPIPLLTSAMLKVILYMGQK